MREPYLYPDCETLKNLADIRDEQTLKNMEADYRLSGGALEGASLSGGKHENGDYFLLSFY